MTYQVFDDLLTVEEQEQIKQHFLGPNMLWKFSRFSAYRYGNEEVSNEERDKLFGFSHPVFQNGQYQSNKEFLMCKNIILKLCERLDMPLTYIFNLICHLQVPTTSTNKSVVHVDSPTMDRPYKSCVYYLADADGPTTLYKQTTKDTTPEEIKEGKYEVLTQIHPKQGRLVVFDGDRYHSSSKPNEDIRCILNFCFY